MSRVSRLKRKLYVYYNTGASACVRRSAGTSSLRVELMWVAFSRRRWAATWCAREMPASKNYYVESETLLRRSHVSSILDGWRWWAVFVSAAKKESDSKLRYLATWKCIQDRRVVECIRVQMDGWLTMPRNRRVSYWVCYRKNRL